jgi:UDP-GlcNAc:undecaprenyl-phosphate GlcNAc-1-phosphate transferase
MNERDAVALLLVGSFAVAWLLTQTLIRLAPRIGLVDVPNERKVHTLPTPKGGGLAILLALLSLTLVPRGMFALIAGETFVLPELLKFLALLLGCASLVALLGLIDDIRPLHWTVRLGIQALCAGIILSVWAPPEELLGNDWGELSTHGVPIRVHPALAFTIGVVWLAGMINAFNMLDNMDALSGGIALIGAGFLAWIIFPDRPEGLTEKKLFLHVLLPLMGALAGFLWFNRPPARIFMGDCGSTLLGFLLGFTVWRLVCRSPRLESVLAAILIFAVPLYDMTSVVILRLCQGRSPFHADKQHLSHRLVDRGLSKPGAVLVIHILALVSGACGLVVYYTREPAWAIGLSCLVLSGWLALALFEFVYRWKTRTP